MWDNDSGNKIGINTQGYPKLFRALLTVYERHIDDILIKKDSPSALRCRQMAHQKNSLEMDCGRLFVMDNVYMRHTLGKKLLNITYGEANC